MRRCRLVLAASALLIAALAPAGSAGEPQVPAGTDWLLMTVTADDHHEVTAEIDVKGAATGAGSVVLGVGVARPRWPPMVQVMSFGTGERTVTTSRQLGGAHIEIVPGDASGFRFGVTARFAHVEPGDRLSVLVFTGNGAFTDGAALASGAGRDHPVPAAVTSGRGTRVFEVAPADANGAGVEVSGAAAAGSTSQLRRALDGVVGGASWGCDACRLEWAAPDGRAGALVSARGGVGGVSTGWSAFAGPRGVWRFDVVGADMTGTFDAPVLAAMAPIGDAWRLFQTPE